MGVGSDAPDMMVMMGWMCHPIYDGYVMLDVITDIMMMIWRLVVLNSI